MTERVLLVRAGGTQWTLPLAGLLHVGELGRLVPVPHAAPEFCGVVTHRGDVVPVLDVARLLGTDDPAATLVAFVRRAGDVVGLRLAGIDDVRRRDAADAPRLDVDALRLAIPPPLTCVAPNAAARRQTAAKPPPERGLAVTLAGQSFWLGLEQVLEVLDAALPVPVPWADPLAPAVLPRGGEAIAVVRLDRLLGLTATPRGPLVLGRAGHTRVAFQVDGIEGLTARGGRAKLDLRAVLEPMAGFVHAAPLPAAPAPSRGTPADLALPYVAVVIGEQSCLLPLRVVRSVAEHVRPAMLPHAPPGVLGMRAMRGHILPVVDPRVALRLPQGEPPLVDVEVMPPDAPAFVLAARLLDGIVRPPANAFRAGRGEAVAGIARLGGGSAWLLNPSALLPAPVARRPGLDP